MSDLRRMQEGDQTAEASSEQSFEDILRDFDLDSEDVPVWEVEDPIWALARHDPAGLFAAAARHLDDEDRSARYLAAVGIGRASEHGTEELAREAEELLVGALRTAPDREVAVGLVNAVNHAWCRLGGDYDRQFDLAVDPDANCRLAAAQFFALASAEPAPKEIEAVLARLAADDDEDVRWWATDGRREDADDD